MDVKGTAVITTPKFVEQVHGPQAHARWLAALSPASHDIFKGIILPSTWYPASAAISDPTRLLCDMFYGGKHDGAWKLGRFSAEFALHGIYKLLVRMASPRFVVEKGSSLIANYYRPMQLATRDLDATHLSVTFSGMDEPTEFVAPRIGGWVERAFEICGAKGVAVSVEKNTGSAIEMLAGWTD